MNDAQSITTKGTNSAAIAGIARQERVARKVESRVMGMRWAKIGALCMIPVVAYFVLTAWGKQASVRVGQMAHQNAFQPVHDIVSTATVLAAGIPTDTPYPSLLSAFDKTQTAWTPVATPHKYPDIVRLPGGSVMGTAIVPTPAP